MPGKQNVRTQTTRLSVPEEIEMLTKKSPLEERLSRVEVAAINLRQGLDQLSAQLHPVLTCGPYPTSGETKDSSSSILSEAPLMERLQSHLEVLNDLSSTLLFIRENLVT